MGLKEVERTNCYSHQKHFTLFSVHLYICECVWAVHKHAHLNECDYLACEDALHLRVSCVVLQCCDRPDLEKHRDRELRLSAW